MSQQKKPDNPFKLKGIKILGSFAVNLKKIFLAVKNLKSKRLRRFMQREKLELKQLTEDQQDLPMFWDDSKQFAKDSFIPSESNDHRPLVLRPRSLATYALIALVFKLSVAGFLYTTYPSEAELSEIISANMLSLTNQSRAEEGIAPLEYNETLARFAQIKGQDMIDKNYFAHDTPDGKRPWEWINRGEYDYVYAGENLAMDFITAEVIQAAFLKSPSHRKNILNSKYKNIGIAVLRGELDGRQTTLLVEFFGTQRQDLDSLVLADQPATTKPIEPTEPVPAEIAGVETNQLTKPAQNEIPPRHKTLAEDPTNPTPGPINEGVIVVATTQQDSKTIVDEVVAYSNIFFIAFLLFIGISLLLNIFINIRVQHASLILQSVVVIALLASFMLVKFHFIETVAPQMLIL